MNQGPEFWFIKLKCALSGQRQFSATENLLRMIKNVFYFT